MIVSAVILAAVAAAVNAVYFRIKRDKLFFPVISAVIFSVIISILLFNKLDMLNYVKTFAVLSLLHLCGTNDIIRRTSDDIFPVLIIAIGLIMPSSLTYMLISFAAVTIMFIVIIAVSKQTIGGGDIKIICALSFFFGIHITIAAVIIACIIGIAFSVIVKFAAKLPDFNKRYPFLPSVEAGFLTALLLQLY